MDVVKILVTGAFNSGKTEFIRTISEIEVVSILTKTGLEPAEDDGIVLDFGRIVRNGAGGEPEAALYIYATPGARRFDPAYHAPILAPREHSGIVFLVDPSRPKDFGDARLVLNEVRRADRPYVIVVNRWDNSNALPTDAVRDELRIEAGETVHRCNVRDRAKLAAVINDVLARMVQDEAVGLLRGKIGEMAGG